MSSGPAFYIVTVSGGTVLEKTAAGMKTKDVSDEQAQRWTIEYDGDSETKVAFQSVSNGQYLNCTNGAASGKIDTGAKQWWTLENGRAPSVKIKSNDWPDAYLASAGGSYASGNTVYTWPKQAVWTHALKWYFKDANSAGFKPGAYNSGTAASGGQEAEDLKKREAALAKKEQDIAAELATQKKHSEQLEAKERELKELAESQKNALNSNDDASAEAKKLASQQADLQRQLDDLRSRERQLTARDVELQKKDETLARKERELASAGERSTAGGDSQELKAEIGNINQQLQGLMKQMEAAKAAPPSVSDASADAQELALVKQENTRLKDLVAQLALQYYDAQQQQQQQRRPRKLMNGNSNASSTNGSSPTKALPAPNTKSPTSTSAVKSDQTSSQQTSSSNTILKPSSTFLTKPTSRYSTSSTTSNGGVTKLVTTTTTTGSNSNSNSNSTATKVSKSRQPFTVLTHRQTPSSKLSSTHHKQQIDPFQIQPGSTIGAHVHGTTSGAPPKVDSIDEDMITFDCGHVLHAPPRKLEKRVLGILYEY